MKRGGGKYFLKLFKTLLIFGFFVLAVFGAFAMNHDSGHSMSGGCIAATARGIGCPETASSLDFLSFHLGALQGFSRAVLNQDAMNSLPFLAALALLAIFNFVISMAIRTPRLSLSLRSGLSLEFTHSPQKELVNWLALHENSPAFIEGR